MGASRDSCGPRTILLKHFSFMVLIIMRATDILQKRYLLPVILVALLTAFSSSQTFAAPSLKKKVTIMCYMNGDNNLASEVLYAVDMMETVGSSQDVDIIALVDGRPGENGGYGPQWEQTKLLYITKDEEIGVIKSRVIEDMGEKNLGDPWVLKEFIKKSLEYPSDKYVFILFSHGRGIINPKSFADHGDYKSVFLSPDESGQRAMSHQEFTWAIKNGLSGEKFHLMLFFSCLTNMVEVGYGLQDLTEYMIGSEDEIRLVNNPPGTFQIRGIEPEKLIDRLSSNPDIPALEMGKVTIDPFISQYEANINMQHDDGKGFTVKYPATLALVNCQKYDRLSKSIDILSRYLIEKIMQNQSNKVVLATVHSALNASQKYPSFLNLEYVDLHDFLENLSYYSEDVRIKRLCQNSMDILAHELILYERHTDDRRSNGVSIFFPSFLVPENIYNSHMSMYRNSEFSRDTSWGELIDTYRVQMHQRYTEILLDAYEQAWEKSDARTINSLRPKLSRELRKDLAKGKHGSVTKFLEIVENMDKATIPIDFIQYLQEVSSLPENHRRVENDLLETVEGLLLSKSITDD